MRCTSKQLSKDTVMNTQLNENHMTQKNLHPSKSASENAKEALETFLATPCFNTKQIALESFWEQLIVGDININTQES